MKYFIIIYNNKVMELTKKDYNDILNFYNIPLKDSKKNKVLAENILATKLCRCIKKVKKNFKKSEKESIGICNKSIFKNRNIKLYKFTCNKKYILKANKKTKKKITKLSTNLKFKKKNK